MIRKRKNIDFIGDASFKDNWKLKKKKSKRVTVVFYELFFLFKEL